MAEKLENQYLTLTLEEERYAIHVSRVLEVLECTRVTRLPGTAAYMRGLISLRGKGIPVLDLRSRFGLAEREASTDTAIVVLEVGSGSGKTVIGVLADAVHEVVGLDPAAIEPAPRLGGKGVGDFLKGVGQGEDGFLLVLDPDRLFEEEELAVSTALVAAAPETAGIR